MANCCRIELVKTLLSERQTGGKVRWDDGTTIIQGCLERPQLLFDESGQPTHLFVATGDGPGGFDKCTETWNMVIPLKV